ncbi:MAG: CCA tRNA nucleotidyltransferase [Phycisphaerales bacterium]|nr:MAG: CCA tRNA nucleotidyltransferase [Phycisphaerales bacterium]
MQQTPQRRAAEQIASVLRKAGHVALFAGGCVRDMLMGRSPKDIDIATDAPPARVVRLFRRTRKVGAKFGVVMVRVADCELEVATFRTESDYADHRRPRKVVFSTAEADAQRRDFTINGMFYDPVADNVIDYVGGRADLDAGLIRAIGEADRRFDEDHLRMLRAVRFAARFEFKIEERTHEAIRRNAPGIRTISAERVRMEIEQILTDVNRRRGWELLRRAGLSAHLAEGLTWTDAQADAGARRLDALPETASFPLALAALLRAEAPPDARRVCTRLRCSSAHAAAVEWLLAQLPRVTASADLELADIKLLAADPRFADLTALLRADLDSQGLSPEPHAHLLDRARRIVPSQLSPPPLLTGEDLVALNVPAGPQYGKILAQVYRAQLNDRISDREAALAMARNLLEEKE